MLSLVPATARIVDLRSGQALDHAGLASAVAARAAALREAGVRRGAIVASCHASSLVLLVDLLAAWRLGAAGLILSPTMTEPERQRLTDWAKPACWIADRPEPNVPCLEPQLMTGHHHFGFAEETPAPDDAALILLTSGSTGRPKGVVLSHRALRARIEANIANIGHADMTRSLALLPLHFGHGLIGNSLTPLMSGATLMLWTEPGVDGLARLGTVIDENGATFMSSVPSMWRIALRIAAPPARGSLRRLHVGSEPLSSELWQGICAWAGTRRVFNMYGMTEAANWIGGESAEAGAVDGAVGLPWSGSWKVFRDDGRLADRGTGEVVLSDAGLMTGYLNDPAATAAVLEGGWFKTGDVGTIDEAGKLRIVGRIKHQINRGGIKVSAEEIDLLLEQHPDVQEACAFAADDPVSGEIVAAALVPKSGRDIDPAGIKAWCAARLRREAVPGRIVVLPALPRSDRGKVRRDEVKAQALRQHGS